MRPVVVAVVCLVLAGCGSASDGGGGTATASKSPEETFKSTCGSCHTLADAGTSGSFGPVLDEVKPDKALVLATIAKGPGGMPSNLLEGAQAEAVAGYVSSVAGK